VSIGVTVLLAVAAILAVLLWFLREPVSPATTSHNDTPMPSRDELIKGAALVVLFRGKGWVDLVRNTTGELVGFWLAENPNPLQPFLLSLVPAYKLGQPTHIAILYRDYRFISNSFDQRGGYYVLIGSATIPGEQRNADGHGETPVQPGNYPGSSLVTQGRLFGAEVLMIHTGRRNEDSNTLAQRLRILGAKVEMLQVSDDGLNKRHVGRIYSSAANAERAQEISQIISDVEMTAPTMFPDAQYKDSNGITVWVIR